LGILRRKDKKKYRPPAHGMEFIQEKGTKLENKSSNKKKG